MEVSGFPESVGELTETLRQGGYLADRGLATALPIISAGVALTVSEAVIYLLVQHANLTVNGQSGGILVVLVIGASTDYALLLVARYREELGRHSDRHQAMAIALRRAGPAIIASGLTVVAGMLCLLAAESNDISAWARSPPSPSPSA